MVDDEVRSTGSGEFKPMGTVQVATREARRAFQERLAAAPSATFTERLSDGAPVFLRQNLSWKSAALAALHHMQVGASADPQYAAMHRLRRTDDPILRPWKRTACSSRGAGSIAILLPRPLEQSEPNFLSLIAAEHTAQLNAAQPEEVFSEAEKHEARFQDIEPRWRAFDQREPAIDVLSSTNDHGSRHRYRRSCPVSLRNMPPPGQLSATLGTRRTQGNAVATVVAFGSSDSHDDHYFVAPDEMIRGPVVDPR